MIVSVVGISFHSAPLELREQASLRSTEVPMRLQGIRAEFPGSELVLLSTCNRTELYSVGIDATAHKDRLIRHLLRDMNNPQAAELGRHFYVKQDIQAAEHLFAVASSLDAMVVGETEILGQVKQALLLAGDNQTAGKVVLTLFQNAFKTAKRVHSETDICRGRVSVASLAVEFAEKIFDNLIAKTVMIVGAGETAELALKNLIDRGTRDILVLNRTHAHGQHLAERCGGRAVQFDLLEDYLAKADIVISSTSAPHLVIRADAVRRAIQTRRGRPILLIDIAVPRDIDPEAGLLDNVYVYTIDDLQRLAADNLSKRQEAVDAAWRIVREGLSGVMPLFDGGGLRTVLRNVDEYGRRICETALQKAMAKEKLATLPEASREEIRELASKIVSKMLAGPRESLKRASRNGDWEHYAGVVNDLFGFDPKEQGKDRDDQDDRTIS